MNDWFEWNGVRCTNYGIHCASLPPIMTPNERIEFTDIPGRNGSYAVLQGPAVYNDLEISVSCFVEKLTNMGDIIQFLKGTGIITFANRPNGYYRGRIINGIQFQPIVMGSEYRSFSVTFRCEPFFYMEDSIPESIDEPGIVTNHGMVFSQPRITVNYRVSGTGSGKITLTIGETSVLITPVPIPTFSTSATYEDGAHVYYSSTLYVCIEAVETAGSWASQSSKWEAVPEGYVEEAIIIDSELMECFDGDGETYANSRVSLEEFPILEAGANSVSWSYAADSGSSQTVTVASVDFVKRERSL